MLKKIIISIIIIAIVLTGGAYGGKQWLLSLLPDKAHFDALKQTQTTDLSYVSENVPENRGKILAVVTSVDQMGKDKTTGYEHTELARAYWVFIANGFEVDFASPKGGKPPVVLDGEDMGAYDYAFLNDSAIQARVNNSIALADIDPLEYEAVYFVGGKGTMFDFPDDPDVQRIAKTLYQHNRVVSAVCHGPAALVNVQLDNGEMLLANKRVSGFTNDEELFLIPDAEHIFPFLLQDKLIEQGALFEQGERYLEQVSQHGKLITGQNPWSVWAMAEMVVAELGYTPKPRQRTPEEYSIELLMTYNTQGFEAASESLKQQPDAYMSLILLMHGIVAFMEFDVGKGVDLIRLTSQLKDSSVGG